MVPAAGGEKNLRRRLTRGKKTQGSSYKLVEPSGGFVQRGTSSARSIYPKREGWDGGGEGKRVVLAKQPLGLRGKLEKNGSRRKGKKTKGESVATNQSQEERRSTGVARDREEKVKGPISTKK